MKDVDARLLRRLSDVNNGIAVVLLLLLERWNNDIHGGLPPAGDLRSVGNDLVTLGRDMIIRADEVDQIVTGQQEQDHGRSREGQCDGDRCGAAGHTGHRRCANSSRQHIPDSHNLPSARAHSAHAPLSAAVPNCLTTDQLGNQR